MCPRSGLVDSALRLLLHHRTHEDEVGVRVAELSLEDASDAAEPSVGVRFMRRSSPSSSDLTDSSSESGWGETGRDDTSERWSCKAASRHVTSASMSGDPSSRLRYLLALCHQYHEEETGGGLQTYLSPAHRRTRFSSRTTLSSFKKRSKSTLFCSKDW